MASLFKIADDCIKLLKIKVSDREQLVKNLSGGNQQKVIIARWLATQPNLLIIDEPTRGIDVDTKTEIQKMAISLAKQRGMSVVFISSEMDEMIRTCTKLVVMRNRRKVAKLTGEDISSDGINATAARYADINVTLVIFLVYAFSGLIESSLIRAADANNADGGGYSTNASLRIKISFRKTYWWSVGTVPGGGEALLRIGKRKIAN